MLWYSLAFCVPLALPLWVRLDDQAGKLGGVRAAQPQGLWEISWELQSQPMVPLGCMRYFHSALLSLEGLIPALGLRVLL